MKRNIFEKEISVDVVTSLRRRVELEEINISFFSIDFFFVVKYLDSEGRVLNNRRLNSFPVRLEINLRDHKAHFSAFCEAVEKDKPLKPLFIALVKYFDNGGFFD